MQDASAHYLHVHTCIQNTPIPYICTHSFRNLCEKWFIRVEQLINVTEQLRFAVYSFLFVIPGAFYHSHFSAGVPAMIANYFVFYKLSYYCGRLCNKWCRMDRKHWHRTIVYLMCVDQVAFDTETSNDIMWKVTDSYKNPACGTRKLGKMKLNGRNEWNNQNNRRKNWFVKRTTEKNKKNCQNWEEH